eukprot:6208522-Pleurochrysis_carterae.AAC.1
MAAACADARRNQSATSHVRAIAIKGGTRRTHLVCCPLIAALHILCVQVAHGCRAACAHVNACIVAHALFEGCTPCVHQTRHGIWVERRKRSALQFLAVSNRQRQLCRERLLAVRAHAWRRLHHVLDARRLVIKLLWLLAFAQVDSRVAVDELATVNLRRI